MGSKKWLIVVLFLASFFRLVFIKSVPPGLANDELNIVLNAQSLLNTGRNIPGVVTGVVGSTSGDLSGGIHSEISSYLLVPFIALLGFNWLGIKLAFVVASLSLVVTAYLFAKEIVNKEVGFLAAILASVNPWLIQFGRSAYESIFSAAFYMFGGYLMLKLKGKRLLWVIPIFIFGFLSYFSAKVVLIPFVLVISGYLFVTDESGRRALLLLNLFLILFVIFYFGALADSPAGVRISELQNQNFSEVVDAKRTASIDNSLVRIFENKLVENLRFRAKAALGALSPSYVFLDGNPEPSLHLSIPDHAPMFLADLLFILLGIVFLARTSVSKLFLLIGIVATTTLPNFLNLGGTTYTIRTVVLFPTLVVISAIGVYYCANTLFARLSKSFVYLIIFLAYLPFVANFSYQYFSRLPVENSGGFFLQRRIAVRYAVLSLAQSDAAKIVMVVDNPKHNYYNLLYFANAYDSAFEVSLANAKLRQGDYSLGDVQITNVCPLNFDQDTSYLVDASIGCNNWEGSSIASIKDGGKLFGILNDKLCEGLVERRYPLVKSYSDLDIETMPRENFCKMFIVNPYLSI